MESLGNTLWADQDNALLQRDIFRIPYEGESDGLPIEVADRGVVQQSYLPSVLRTPSRTFRSAFADNSLLIMDREVRELFVENLASAPQHIAMELVVQIEPQGFLVDFAPSERPSLEKDALFRQRQSDLYDAFEGHAYRTLLDLGFSRAESSWSPSLRFLGAISTEFVKALIRSPDLEHAREATGVAIPPETVKFLLDIAPYLLGREYLDASWIAHIWEQLGQAFSAAIAPYEGPVSAWIRNRAQDLSVAGRVFFHLVENKQGDYPFAFLATYSSESLEAHHARHLPLKNALVEYQGQQAKLLDLLATVNQTAQNSRLIANFVESGDIFHPIGLSADEAYRFLSEVPLYEAAGVLCRIPKWWRSKAHALRLEVKVGDRVPAHLGGRALIDFQTQLALGGDPLTAEELAQLLDQTEGLALIKGKWMEIDHARLKEILAAYQAAEALSQRSELTLVEALRFQLDAEAKLSDTIGREAIEISNGTWLESVMARLAHPDKLAEPTPGPNFRADLRPYQARGLAWLTYMKTLSLGACLADDMGLGKTIQVIALLNHLLASEPAKALLVIPASLIGNWQNELARFAPTIRTRVLHPSVKAPRDEDPGEAGEALLSRYDVFVTTYTMLTKQPWLSQAAWDVLVLDEAQAIKNPSARQTKAVKQVASRYRIAMTGTPVENRLSDLWSLFDFLNPGLLGTSKEFTDFAKGLSEHPEGYGRLRRVVGPFILRRHKTDPAVVPDLPDKIEMKTFALLSKRQAALYQSVVEDLAEKLQSTDRGIQRRGLILSSLLKFKQICNHPDQYLGQKGYLAEESGKFQRLRELTETLYEKRERVLVFTQFREITGALAAYLETIFHHRGLVLTGQTPVKDRTALVAQFQGHDYVPFFVLSLKAGGVGLNLTAANHVIHFDRWWNPAVENQATDRAFRIGQKNNVVVHKLISRGTIEEKIDALIEEKMRLSAEIVSDAGETWITEMDNEQLLDLFRLSI